MRRIRKTRTITERGREKTLLSCSPTQDGEVEPKEECAREDSGGGGRETVSREGREIVMMEGRDLTMLQ